MDPSIKRLKSTTFYGRRFTRRQLEQIRSMVAMFRSLSRQELAQTVCENLDWRTEAGENRVFACLKMLEALEQAGVLRLPAKDLRQSRGARAPVKWSGRGEPAEPVVCELQQLAPIELQQAVAAQDIDLFDELVDRYHYLGFRRPMGHYLRYFIVDGAGRRLGCLLFQQASVRLRCRDEWIGWHGKAYRKRLNQVIQNARFLILPWVRVSNLASKSWSLVRAQLARDWHSRWKVTPVLVESFVDREGQGFSGASYRAGGWRRIGETEPRAGKSVKDVYVMPLCADARQILCTGRAAVKKPGPRAGRLAAASAQAPFVQLWQGFIADAAAVAGEYDLLWQRRQRVLNTLLIMLFIFRLVFSKNHQGYQTTVNELWEHCRMLKIALPQPAPPVASSLCTARCKLDEQVFKDLHRQILARLDSESNPAQPGAGRAWCGRRLLAVDGTKINVPRELLRAGYTLPTANSCYPQGLVSCLYRTGERLPVDYELSADLDERRLAQRHLSQARAGEVVVYDRGYFSFELLHHHQRRGIDCIFRLAGSSATAFREFIASGEQERLIDLRPGRDTLRRIRNRHPGFEWQPVQVRCVSCRVGGSDCHLATALTDSRQFSAAALSDAYHGRWGIEELYKISKRVMEVGPFHAKSERGVKQELYAHFVLVVLARSFGNGFEDAVNAASAAEQPRVRANFKNVLTTLARNFEALMLGQWQLTCDAVANIFTSIDSCVQKERPGRTYPRHSRRPDERFRNANRKARTTA